MESRQPIDIGVLTQFLNSLESYSQELIQHLRSGQKLCHYTTLAGAQSIISSGDLWLTNSRYSNDDEELDYGHRLVDAVLDTLEKQRPRPKWLKQLRQRLTEARGDQVYICCFCEQNDLLSQWRGYAENGGGISIEFEPLGFAAIAGGDCPTGLMRLWKVFYDLEQQQQLIRKCIDYPYWPAGSEEERIRFVVDALQFFMPTFKNSAFREEQERRLIFTPHPAPPNVPSLLQPSFRTRGSLLVPYYSLQRLSQPAAPQPSDDAAFRLPISSVLVGPAMNRELNVVSAGMMLEAHGYGGVPVKASAIPYRG